MAGLASAAFAGAIDPVVSTSTGAVLRASRSRLSALRASLGRESSSAFWAVTMMSPRVRPIMRSALFSASVQLWPGWRQEQLWSTAFWYLKALARRA
jgi:hypothetical protein